MDERYELLFRLHEVDGHLTYTLAVFGDQLASEHGYPSGLRGLEAIRYYLMQKHNWLPAQVRSLSYEDLAFAMSKEREGWTLPKEARPSK